MKGKYDEGVHFEVTGEFRPPKEGEYYLPGVVLAHQATGDMVTPYWIARKVVKKKRAQKTDEQA